MFDQTQVDRENSPVGTLPQDAVLAKSAAAGNIPKGSFLQEVRNHMNDNNSEIIHLTAVLRETLDLVMGSRPETTSGEAKLGMPGMQGEIATCLEQQSAIITELREEIKRLEGFA